MRDMRYEDNWSIYKTNANTVFFVGFIENKKIEKRRDKQKNKKGDKTPNLNDP